MRRKIFTSLMMLAMVFGAVGMSAAATFSVTDVDGDWANVVGGQNVSIQNDLAPNGTLARTSWGGSGSYSSYEFISALTPFDAFSTGTAFNLGQFTHNNYPIPSGSGIDKIDLLLSMTITNFGTLSTSFNFDHTETPNNYYPDSNSGNNDLITLTNPILNANFITGGYAYYFNLVGFSTDGGNTIKTTFSTIEGLANHANLYGMITERPITTPEPATMLLLGLGLVGLAGLRRGVKK